MKLNKILCSIMCLIMMVPGISTVSAAENEGADVQTRAAGTLYEQESNNTMTSANQTYDDYDNYGAISSTGDVDYWKVVFTQKGRANFWLGNVPTNCNYDLYLYNQSGSLIASSTNVGQNAELLQQSVVAGMTYYVKIVSSSGYSSVNYLFRVKNYPTGTTWFCQFNSGVGTTWNSNYLTSLYFPNMSNCTNYCAGVNKCANTPFYTSSSFVGATNQFTMGHVNRFGCNVSSMAMIFRNLEATTSNNKYDFRNGTTARQSADPFTITMANIGWPSVTVNNNSGTTRYEITSYTSSYNPTYSYWATISNAFGLTPHKVSLDNYEPEEKADIIAYYLAQNPEGVLVRVANSHSIVFTDTTHDVPSALRMIMPQPVEVTIENQMDIIAQERQADELSVATVTVSSTEFDSLFTCYDPGTSNVNKGNGVTFNNSYAATKYGGLDVVNYIYYFD